MATPIESVIQDALNVAKADFRSWANNRLAHRFESVATVQSTDLTSLFYLIVGTVIYYRDTTDTTSSHNGTTVLVDSGGNRWKAILGDSQINPRGAYSNSTEYSKLDLVESQNASWLYLNDTASTGNTPPTLPTTSDSYWMLFAKGGDKEKYLFSDNDRPASGETLATYAITETVTIDSSAPDSQAIAEVAATSSAAFTLRKSDPGTSPTDIDIGTVTFGAGSRTGSFSVSSAVSLAAGDTLSVIAPNPRDATLSGVSITIVASRP